MGPFFVQALPRPYGLHLAEFNIGAVIIRTGLGGCIIPYHNYNKELQNTMGN